MRLQPIDGTDDVYMYMYVVDVTYVSPMKQCCLCRCKWIITLVSEDTKVSYKALEGVGY